MKRTPISHGGIYFVVPFPTGWEVCAFPFGLYPDVGHALTWERLVAPQLAMRWASTLYSTAELDSAPELIARLQRQLATLYDAVPRGRALMPPGSEETCHIYHGNDLTRSMRTTKGKITRALGIVGRRRWVRDEHETRNLDSKDRLGALLDRSTLLIRR